MIEPKSPTFLGGSRSPEERSSKFIWGVEIANLPRSCKSINSTPIHSKRTLRTGLCVKRPERASTPSACSLVRQIADCFERKSSRCGRIIFRRWTLRLASRVSKTRKMTCSPRKVHLKTSCGQELCRLKEHSRRARTTWPCSETCEWCTRWT